VLFSMADGKNGEEGINTVTHGGWVVRSFVTSIVPSCVVEQWTEELDVPSLPEMVFGNSFLDLLHLESNLQLRFTTYEALKAWRNAPWFHTAHQVACANEWSSSRDHPEDLLEARTHDWTFTTPYIGTINMPGKENLESLLQPTNEKIDVELLKRPDPILYFADVMLYEDELADNGTAMLSVKVRMMPTCLYILLRFWLRIDNVLFRIKDTRIFQKFGTNSLIIETSHREETFESLQKRRALPLDPRKYTDQNLFSQILTLRESKSYKIELSC